MTDRVTLRKNWSQMKKQRTITPATSLHLTFIQGEQSLDSLKSQFPGLNLIGIISMPE